MDRSPLTRLMEHATGIIAVLVAVVRSVGFHQRLLDVPIVDSGADGELQILLCDGVPVLVDHHYAEQVRDGGEKDSVEIVLNAVADFGAEDIQQDLTDDEEENTKGDVSEGPSFLQCADDQEDLHNDVDKDENGAEDVDHDEQSDCVCWAHSANALEGEDADRKADQEHDGRADSEQPDGQGRAVLVQLESDEAVDHQADAGRRSESVLYGNEIWKGARSRRHDTAVEEKRDDGEEEVKVEEGQDFLTSWKTCQSRHLLSNATISWTYRQP